MRADILVVDDEAGPRESLRIILKHDHDVRTADGGRAALREVERQTPDLVLLDLRMPDMDGTEVLRELERTHPDVAVAIVTAYAGVESARIAVKCGAIDYLTKPYSVADVEAIVAKALGSRRQQHETELLGAQLAKMTETLVKRTRSLGAGGHSPTADALDSVTSAQSSLHEDLQSAHDLSDLGEVAAEVSHDIGNLLGVVLTSSGLLLREMGEAQEVDSETVTARVSAIIQAAEDCTSIIRSIRNLTRMSVTESISAIDVNDLVSLAVALKREAVSASGESAEYRLRLTSVPPVYGDEVILRSMLVNLIENSLDALGENGFIEVSTRRSNGWVEIQVRDNGSGMPADVLASATEAFFSTKNGRGTGLGLSIVDKAIERHRGTLDIASTEAEGTTITVGLPTQPPEEMTDDAATREHAGTIVLVEDEESTRRVIELVLESEGYQVLSAPDGTEGWELFQRAYRQPTDGGLMLITDHEVPGMLGRDITKRVKELSATIPVLIVSGYELVGRGPEDLLMTKPFDVEELISSVRKLMGRSTLVPAK